MIVYVVTTGNLEDYQIRGVRLVESEADALAAMYYGGGVEQWDTSLPLPMPIGLKRWHVMFYENATSARDAFVSQADPGLTDYKGIEAGYCYVVAEDQQTAANRGWRAWRKYMRTVNYA